MVTATDIGGLLEDEIDSSSPLVEILFDRALIDMLELLLCGWNDFDFMRKALKLETNEMVEGCDEDDDDEGR